MVSLFLAVPTNHYRSRKYLVNDVHRQLNRISVKWDDIARELRLDWNTREELRGKPEWTCDYKLESVLYKWSQSSESSEVNWDTIMKVLERLSQREILKSVKKYLLNDPEAVQKYSWTEN